MILSPFCKSDFGMKQQRVCTFKWASTRTAIFDLYLVFSCTVTYKKNYTTHCTSRAFEGDFYVLLSYNRQKESLIKHTKMKCFLDDICFATPFYPQRKTGHLPSWLRFLLRTEHVLYCPIKKEKEKNTFYLAFCGFWSLWYAVL